MHPRCRLRIRARRGPSAIFYTRYKPVASPTAAADPVVRRDPCSCRLAGTHGANVVRPRPCRVYMGTPLLRLTPSPGDTPTAYTRSDALGNAAELRFHDSVARYSHDNCKREQHAEPTCHAMIRCVLPAGNRSSRPTFWRATFRTSVHPSQTSRSWRVTVAYKQPTTTSSYSSIARHCRQQDLTNPTLRGALLAC